MESGWPRGIKKIGGQSGRCIVGVMLVAGVWRLGSSSRAV
jgi:hypothetical protein